MFRAIRFSFVLFIPLALPAAAQEAFGDMLCSGAGWRLEITGDAARFAFLSDSAMTIPLTTYAEGTVEGIGYPRALTLIGETDTAIALLHRRACPEPQGDAPIEAQVLTQRLQTPVLLTGCCRAAP
ncbi:hypothetical protein IV417_05290 [Alphaproteobacteria bacterium KMM 3653]|uniref:Uncharacterized protein n=1 Tax=Harenicola maris TaxID=2841044 RepID=A0AAP2G7S0_9RHOB|nr:hypothetical protein [Harenicola maris]